MATIFAVSSGAPPAAIAVMRISGNGALAAAKVLAGSLPAERRAALRTLRDPVDGSILDSALVLVFRGPATATGEDLVELHLHGGRAVIAAVDRVLETLPGLRAAEPGEFTRRALIAGRIDLTEAEGLADLLSAETETQRRAAMSAADGGVRRRVEGWSAKLLTLSARVEAELDFSDEDDLAPLALREIIAKAAELSRDIDMVLDQPPVERLRNGIHVVLAGPPNSGKSTLFNAMADREAAIVSPIAGTTRDRIDVPVSRNGLAYLLTDTAGLAEVTDDQIEAIGILRAQRAMDDADIILWLGDKEGPQGALWLHPRADQTGREMLPPGPVIGVSAKNGDGLVDLWAAIEQRTKSLVPRLDEVALNRRQRNLARQCSETIAMACQSSDVLIIGENLRTARIALDHITGHTDTEAMLDTLFGAFCIGK